MELVSDAAPTPEFGSVVAISFTVVGALTRMFDLPTLIWLAVIALAAFYWTHAQRAREAAFMAARRHCEQMGVQMLDQTVYLRRLWFKRRDSGRFSFWRAFHFEFTVSGSDRYRGRVLTLGRNIISVELEPHRVH